MSRLKVLLLLAGLTLTPAGAAPPQLLVQNGHSGSLTAMVVAPDGRHVVTGGADSAFKIWASGSDRVQSTRFLPVGNSVNGAGISSLALTGNGRLLAVGTWSSLSLWDISDPLDPVKVQDVSLGSEAVGYQPIIARFARHDDTLLVGLGGTVSFYRMADSHATFDHESKALGDAAYGLAVSADGSLLATGDNSDVAVTNLQTDQTVHGRNNTATHNVDGKLEAQRIAFAPDNTVAATGGGVGVWDPSSVHVRQTLALDDAHLVAYSPDGRYLAATVADHGDIRLWNAQSGQVEKTFSYERRDLDTTALTFTPDSHRLLVGYTDGTARAFDLQGQPAGEFRGHSYPLRAVAFTPNGQAVVTDSLVDSNVWNLQDGKIRAHVEHDPDHAGAMAIGPDGHRLAIGNDNGSIDIVETATGTHLKTLFASGQRFRRQVTSVAWTPDGTRLAAGTASGYITVLDVRSGDSVAVFEPTNDSYLTSLAFAPDGRTLVSGWDDVHAPEIRQHDVPTKTTYMHRLINGWRGSVLQVAVTADGQSVVALLQRGSIATWPLGDEKAEPTEVNLDGTPDSMALTRDGRHAIVALYDGPVLAVDLVHGKVNPLVQHAYHGWGSVATSPDGRWIVTASQDAVLRFWPSAGASTAAAEAVEIDGGQDWIVTDSRGRFDGTSSGQHLMEWRVGDRIFALDQFFNTYYTPGLLHKVVAGSGHSRDLEISMSKDISTLAPPPRLRIDSPEADKVPEASVTVKATVTDEGGGVSKPALYLNGHRLPDAALLSWQGTTATFRVRLAAGENHLHLTAFNHDASVESRGDDVDLTCNAPVTRPTLYVLAIGIDHYRNGLALDCARSDAAAMATFFKPGLFAAVKPVLLEDGKASKQGILAALNGLSKETGPGDAVIIYLAGHGTVLGDVFYFLPWDVNKDSLEAIRSTGLSSVELGQALVQIPATKQVLIIDACHSGAAAGSLGKMLASRGFETDAAVQRLARTSGSFLIAASKDSQSAKEVPALHHGLLTYAILHGLGADGKPAAAAPGGQVTVNSLLQYVSAAVPQLTEKYDGADTQDIVQASTGQDFPLVLVPR